MKSQSYFQFPHFPRQSVQLAIWTIVFIVALSCFSQSSIAQSVPTPATTTKKQKKAPPLTEMEIQEARTLLTQLGYWINVEAKGLDLTLKHALIAFQKIEMRDRTGLLNRAELEALRTAQRPMPRETGFPHIEVNLARQVLLMVEIGETSLRILPISSGSGEFFTEGGRTRQAITPIGRFAIQRKILGWRKSPLGLLYYPNYFHNGIAIHGNPAVPIFPASHGCVRIPMFAAKEFSKLADVGTVVIVFDDGEKNR